MPYIKIAALPGAWDNHCIRIQQQVHHTNESQQQNEQATEQLPHMEGDTSAIDLPGGGRLSLAHRRHHSISIEQLRIHAQIYS